MKRLGAILWAVVLGLGLLAGCVAREGKSFVPSDPLSVLQGTYEAYAPDGQGYVYTEEGWRYLHIEGEPHDRGYQHGFLMAESIGFCINTQRQLLRLNTGVEWEYLKNNALRMWTKNLDNELGLELKGIVAGAQDAGQSFDLGDLLVWNASEELESYWLPGVKQSYYDSLEGGAATNGTPEWRSAASTNRNQGSAFIATGRYTRDGHIVAGHSTTASFAQDFGNVLIEVVPTEGQRFLMQTKPGCIASNAAFYQSETLLITGGPMTGFTAYTPGETPMFEQARLAAQYATSLNEFAQRQQPEGSGDYGYIWLVGELATDTVMRFERGAKWVSQQRAADTVYTACGVPQDARIRALETEGSGHADISSAQEAQRMRLAELLAAQQGRLDTETARKLFEDHEDLWLEREQASGRTLCAHGDEDGAGGEEAATLPYEPFGTVDTVISSRALAEAFELDAHLGSACGRGFHAETFLEKHGQFGYLSDYLFDRPDRDWTRLGAK